ncbi:HNH endonuclease [Brevibacterium picturae]
MDPQAAGNPTDGSSLFAEIARLSTMLRELEGTVSEAESLDRITAYEELKATLSYAQARETVQFASKRVKRDELNRLPVRQWGVRVGDEIGLAKKSSPGAGRAFLNTAQSLVGGLPGTFKALSVGKVSEQKARVMVEETDGLTNEDKRTVDARMGESLGPSGIRGLRSEARALVQELRMDDAAEKVKRATARRRLTLTALRDGMGRPSATLPLQQAVAAFEGLKSTADTAVAQGTTDDRSHGQFMADTCVERLTGQAAAAAVPTEVHLIVDAKSLFSDGLAPSWIPGYGPLPARTARNFIASNEAAVFIRRMFTASNEAAVFIRRMFTAAEGGHLVGMESRARSFTGKLRQMVVFRDDMCRTPCCDAPIKHADHADPHADGGKTSWENASGLCASCNYAKEHPGWKHAATADGVTVTTPSGKDYSDVTPPLLKRMRHTRSGPQPSRMEDYSRTGLVRTRGEVRLFANESVDR